MGWDLMVLVDRRYAYSELTGSDYWVCDGGALDVGGGAGVAVSREEEMSVFYDGVQVGRRPVDFCVEGKVVAAKFEPGIFGI